jgi:hypothetical protein
MAISHGYATEKVVGSDCQMFGTLNKVFQKCSFDVLA